MNRTAFGHRVDTLAETWRAWAELGTRLPEPRWAAPSRCDAWTVADLYAHHSLFPLALASPPSPPAPDPSLPVLTAVDVLRGFNRPGGVAHQMADTVAGNAVDEARRVRRSDLVERFSVIAPKAVDGLRGADPDRLVAWPAIEGCVPLAEALRIVLMEATVHYLDVLRAVGEPPAVGEAALRETVVLLAELADPVDFIEAATGRSATSPWPVLR